MPGGGFGSATPVWSDSVDGGDVNINGRRLLNMQCV